MGLFDFFNNKKGVKKRAFRRVNESDYANFTPDKKPNGLNYKNFKFKMANFARRLLKPKSEEEGNYAVTRISPYRLERKVMQNPMLLAGMTMYQTCCQELIDVTKVHISDTKMDTRFKVEIFPENKSHFQEVYLRMNPLHHGIYGNALTEFVRASKSKRIVDFLNMDIRQYEFMQKDSLTDTINGRPRGFWNTSNRDEVYILGKDAMWSSLYQIHNTEMGWGWAEMLDVNTDQLITTQEARTQRAFRQGFDVPLVKYGNDRIPSNNKRKGEAQSLVELLADPTCVGAHYPEYLDVKYMDEMKGSQNAVKSIENDEMVIRNIESAVLGLPLPIYLMSLKDQPARGVADLEEFFEIRLKSFVRSLRMEYSIKTWADNVNGPPNVSEEDTEESEYNVTIDYDEILSATKKERMMQIFRLGKVDILFGDDKEKNEKIRQKLLQLIGLQSHDEYIEAINKHLDDKPEESEPVTEEPEQVGEEPEGGN